MLTRPPRNDAKCALLIPNLPDDGGTCLKHQQLGELPLDLRLVISEPCPSTAPSITILRPKWVLMAGNRPFLKWRFGLALSRDDFSRLLKQLSCECA